MSSPRPGRRAAPKTSKWSKVRISRGGSSQPSGRRIAEPRGKRAAEAPPEIPHEHLVPDPQRPEPLAPELPLSELRAPELAAPELPLTEPPPPTLEPQAPSQLGELPEPVIMPIESIDLAASRAAESRREDLDESPRSLEVPLLMGRSWTLLAAMATVLVLGVITLALAALHIGPGWLDGVGAVAVLTTYSWAVMARTGGREVVFALLALTVGTVAVVQGGEVLRSGAAVMTCVVSGVLAVVITVPARHFLTVVREVVVAISVASVGAFATVGFEPVASSARFEYITLGLGFLVVFILVWRFGAGLHGLGTRGLIVVVVGTLLLAGSLTYAELLRRYGGGLVEPGNAAFDWARDNLGAVPSPIMVFLGVPALVWGVHMRARRRQGWWVCAFGAAATLPVAQTLVNWDTSYVEAGLQQFYGAVLGVLVGYLVIRLDLRLTGQRGRRARAAEAQHAVRPEPPRFSSL